MQSVIGVRFREHKEHRVTSAPRVLLTAHTHHLASSSLPIFEMERIRKPGGVSEARAPSAPPSTEVPELSTHSSTTLTRPASPQIAPAPLAPESHSALAWTNLKEVLKALCDGSDVYPPLKAALSGVTSVMDSIEVCFVVESLFQCIHCC